MQRHTHQLLFTTIHARKHRQIPPIFVWCSTIPLRPSTQDNHRQAAPIFVWCSTIPTTSYYSRTSTREKHRQAPPIFTSTIYKFPLHQVKATREKHRRAPLIYIPTTYILPPRRVKAKAFRQLAVCNFSGSPSTRREKYHQTSRIFTNVRCCQLIKISFWFWQRCSWSSTHGLKRSICLSKARPIQHYDWH